MRAGYSPALRDRVECADPSFRERLFADVEESSDFVRTRDQWNDADSLTGFRLMDNGIRLADSYGTKIENTLGAGAITDLDRLSPIDGAVLWWAGSDPDDIEIHRVTCRVDPGGGGNDVHAWQLVVWQVLRSGYLEGYNQALYMTTIGGATVLNAGATSPFDAVFDLTDQLPQPKRQISRFDDDSGSDPVDVPITIFQLVAVQSDGTPSEDASWVTATGSVTTGGNILNGKRMVEVGPDYGVYAFSSTITPGRIKIETSSYTGATATFSTNVLDLGATPTGTVEFATRGLAPVGTTLTWELRNDADTAWVEVKDGDTTDDLVGVGKRQLYEWRVTLDEDTTGQLSPQAIEFGVRELLSIDLSETAEIVTSSSSFDPLTLKASVPTAILRAIRDGELDFRSAIEDLFTLYDLGKITIRRFIAADDLDRSEWLHYDDWKPEDYDLQGPAVTVPLLSVLSKCRRRLPRYNETTDTRAALVYANSTPKATYDDLLQNQIGLPVRFIGPGVENVLVADYLTKTIDDGEGKDELDAVAFIDGSLVISSQGQVKAVPVLNRGLRPEAVFPLEELEDVTITPGFRARVPEYFVPYAWDRGAKIFTGEVRRFHGPALLKLDQSDIDAPDRPPDEVSKFISGETLATKVAQRVVDTVGTGLILWRFRSTYARFDLELGDTAVAESDRFIAKDPNDDARALRGPLWARGVIQEINQDGRAFAIWIRSYADIFSSSESVTLEDFVQPVVVTVQPTVAANGDVSVTITAAQAGSVKVSISTSGYPSRATVQGETAQAVDGDGVYSSGTLLQVSAGQTAYISVLAYESATGTGAESELVGKARSTEPFNAFFGTVGSTVDQHIGFGKASAPASGNPAYYLQTNAAATPDAEIAAYDGTTWKTFLNFDYATGSIQIVGDIGSAGGQVQPDAGGLGADASTWGDDSLAIFDTGTSKFIELPKPSGSNDQYLTWIQALGTVQWDEFGGGAIPHALDDHTDVTISGVSTGEYLRKSSGDWLNAALDLTDASAGPNDSFLVVRSGSVEWGAITDDDVPGLPASKIDAGYFGVTRGGTGVTSWNTGALIYASAATTLTDTGTGAIGSVVWNSSGTAWTQLQPAASGIYFLKATNRVVTWGDVKLNELGNPDADNTFVMTTRRIGFLWTNPSGNAMELTASGAYSGALLHIHQHTGNPAAGTYLMEIESTDVDVEHIKSLGPATSTDSYCVYVTGDSVERFVIHCGGELRWGTGSAATDTNLYRSAVGTLKTDGGLIVAGALVAENTLSVTGAFTAGASTFTGKQTIQISGASPVMLEFREAASGVAYATIGWEGSTEQLIFDFWDSSDNPRGSVVFDSNGTIINLSTGTVNSQTISSATILSSSQKTNLTDAGDTTLHYHAVDRARTNHTGTQGASTIAAGTFGSGNFAFDGTLKVAGPLGVGDVAIDLQYLTADDILAGSGVFAINASSASNIDHIWFDDTGNVWHFVADAARKATGNATIVCGVIGTTGNRPNVLLEQVAVYGQIYPNDDFYPSSSPDYKDVTGTVNLDWNNGNQQTLSMGAGALTVNADSSSNLKEAATYRITVHGPASGSQNLTIGGVNHWIGTSYGSATSIAAGDYVVIIVHVVQMRDDVDYWVIAQAVIDQEAMPT